MFQIKINFVPLSPLESVSSAGSVVPLATGGGERSSGVIRSFGTGRSEEHEGQGCLIGW